jgi:hypothetical protein
MEWSVRNAAVELLFDLSSRETFGLEFMVALLSAVERRLSEFTSDDPHNNSRHLSLFKKLKPCLPIFAYLNYKCTRSYLMFNLIMECVTTDGK